MIKNSLLEKFKNFRHKELLLIVLIIVAIAVVLISTNSNEKTKEDISISQLESAEEVLLYQLKEAIGAMSGDEDCKIVLVWEQNENSTLENSFSDIFSSNKSNSCRKVYGVAVVCKNGDDAKLKVNLMNMLSSTLGVEMKNISINSKK